MIVLYRRFTMPNRATVLCSRRNNPNNPFGVLRPVTATSAGTETAVPEGNSIPNTNYTTQIKTRKTELKNSKNGLPKIFMPVMPRAVDPQGRSAAEQTVPRIFQNTPYRQSFPRHLFAVWFLYTSRSSREPNAEPRDLLH